MGIRLVYYIEFRDIAPALSQAQTMFKSAWLRI